MVLKNNSPVLQVAGCAVPVFSGRVEIAPLKSTFRLWFRKSTWVCPNTIPASKHSGKIFTSFLHAAQLTARRERNKMAVKILSS